MNSKTFITIAEKPLVDVLHKEKQTQFKDMRQKNRSNCGNWNMLMWQRAFSKNDHSNISSPSYCGTLPHHYQETESISLLLNMISLCGFLWVGYSERGTVWLSRVGDMSSAWLSLSWDTCPGNQPWCSGEDQLAYTKRPLENEGLRFSSVQLLSRVRLFATPWTAARQASLSITNSQSPPKSTSIVLVMPSDHLILCRPLLLLPLIFSSIRVFSNESALHIRWPKYWSFSFNISPSNEHPGQISIGMDWLDLLAVQGTLKNHLLHHGSKASILQHSAFFIVQLSHTYMTPGKTIALTMVFVDICWQSNVSAF